MDVRSQSERCMNSYHARDITITQVDANNAFTSLADELNLIQVNIVGAGEHAGDIKRYNKIVKEHPPVVLTFYILICTRNRMKYSIKHDNDNNYHFEKSE